MPRGLKRESSFNARRDVRGFYFQSRRLLPTLVLVPTVFRSRKAQDCHPVFEAILRVQPRAGVPLHQIVIFITDIGRKRHRYLIAFRYDPTMGRNRSLEALCEPVVWRGELVVLKGGKRDDVINITTLADRNIAQVAVRFFLEEAGRCIANTLPGSAVIFPGELEHEISETP